MTREELDKRIEEARQRSEVLSQAGVPKRSVGMSVSEVRNALRRVLLAKLGKQP